jgi:hypothetical protein
MLSEGLTLAGAREIAASAEADGAPAAAPVDEPRAGRREPHGRVGQPVKRGAR